VVVTGGSAGIGKAVVMLLAESGYDVGFTYRSRRQEALALEARLTHSGARVVSTPAELAEPDSARAAVRQLAERLGGELHGLVNNAGINRRAELPDLEPSGFAEVMGVNLAAPLFAAQAAVELMPPAGAGGGRIVNVTSILDRVPLKGGSVYCASKAGLAIATQVLALELAPRGITVNSVAPGHTATPMNFGDREIDAFATPRPAIPLGRPAAPREVAAAIAWFLSDDASYTTGTSVLVDGGLALQSGPQSLEASPEFLDNARRTHDA
jgi:NAD(P)-dependent dehydrogenase (short-subunit alcohol dehydrogenase family)